MKSHINSISKSLSGGCFMVLLGVSSVLPNSIQAAQANKNPSSKVYFADVSGEAQIDTGSKIEELAKRSVYTAQGAVIETKKSDKPELQGKTSSTMVYSNGTGAFFDEDTRVEVRKFVQEPFIPNRADAETEPSLSNTQAFVARGTVGLCSSKLVAGSKMTYQTSHGSINVNAKKVVIEASQGSTTISMVEGSSLVQGGSADVGGQILKTGFRAVIRPGEPGQPNIVQISRIPPEEMTKLDDKVSMACAAKKTVYFEVRERVADISAPLPAEEAAAAPDAPTAVTAFDGDSSVSSAVSGAAPRPALEIVAVPLVPANQPVQFTVSPATLIAPTAAKTGG